jgi:hypothetical protein
MRDLKNKLTSGKNTKNIKSRRGKSFGYQVLGFGAGGAQTFITASGGCVATDGNFKVHTFTGNGTFTVCSVASEDANNAVAYLIVAGGAGAGEGMGAGGGGGFREGTTAPVVPYCASPLVNCAGITVTATSFPIVIGAAGGEAPPTGNVTSGANTVALGLTSTGGGRGGNRSEWAGAPGGSGGGGGDYTPATAGNGNTPPVSPSQGNPGGESPSPTEASGGGGGAGGAGSGSSPGAGTTSSITGSAVLYAAGGTGESGTVHPTVAGGSNAMYGLGQGGHGCSATGGGPNAGVVIIRYKFK